MKKIILVCAAMIAVAAMTACKSSTANEHSTPESPKASYSFEDVEITADEFDSAALCAGQWQYIRSEREPLAEDTAIVREWFAKHGLKFCPEAMDECGFYMFELFNAIEICAGDYCCTRFFDDSTELPMYNISLSADGWIGGIYTEFTDEGREEDYVYIYPLDLVNAEAGKHYIGKPFVYKTSPKWRPEDVIIYGADNWLYVEGNDLKIGKKVFHKIRAKTVYSE